MRTFNQLAMALALGSTMFFSASAMAQGSGAPGLDVTNRITNPSFDANTSAGWTVVEGPTPGVNFTTMEVFDAAFNINQTITGLPGGMYELRVNALFREKANDAGATHQDGTEVINAVVYATTPEGTTEEPFASLYSQENFVVTGGGVLRSGYVDNMEGAYQAFAAGHYSVAISNINVTNGTLTIGVKTLGEKQSKCWSIWDNFQLFYIGGEGTLILRQMIDNIDLKLSDYSFSNSVPSGIIKEIENVQAFKEEYYLSQEEEELQALLDSMQIVEIKANNSVETMTAFYAKIDEADAYAKEHYPGEAALNAALDKAFSLAEPDAVNDKGNPVYVADLLVGIAELNAAIVTYRFSQSVPAQGIDCTWAMKSPNFTKEGGDPSLAADASSVGWATNNVATAGDFRLNTINGKNCWNNHSNTFTSMDVYQELESMPAGMYSFSCYQTNDGPAISGQHAYITAVGGTSVSPTATYSFALDTDPDKGKFANSKWEGPLATGKVLVGTDGKLRVGFASVSKNNATSSGWFCITDCNLTYYGMGEGGSFAEALETMIGEAQELEYSEILAVEAAALNSGIKVAETVDGTNDEAAQAALAALSKVIATAQAAINQLAAFKEGSFAKMLAVTANEEMLYSAEIVEFATGVLDNVATILDADTTSNHALPTLESQLAKCFAILPVVQRAEGIIANNTYSQEARTNLKEMMAAQLSNVETDLSLIAQAEKAIGYGINTMILPGEVDPETGTDVTYWIQNPDFGVEETGWDNGWSNDGFNLTNKLLERDDWYVDNNPETWIKAGSRLADKTFSQTTYVPNGEYILSVVSTACQQGTVTIDSEVTKLTTPVKGVWFFANNDSIEIATPMIGEAAPYENQTVNNEPHSQVFELGKVTVTNNTLVFGIKTRSTTANWLAFDNFKLTCFAYDLTGTNEAEADLNAPIVYLENGIIKVSGADEYSISTLDGILVPANTQLVSGIYFVTIGSQTIKIAIE